MRTPLIQKVQLAILHQGLRCFEIELIRLYISDTGDYKVYNCGRILHNTRIEHTHRIWYSLSPHEPRYCFVGHFTVIVFWLCYEHLNCSMLAKLVTKVTVPFMDISLVVGHISLFNIRLAICIANVLSGKYL